MKSVLSALTFAGLCALILTACSSSPSIRSSHDFNPSISFSGFRTYAFISEHPMIVGQTGAAVSPMLEGRLMEAVRVAMNAKGYSESRNPEAADVAISFSVGARDQIRVDSYPASYRAGWGARGSYYGYGYNTETRVRQYTEGQLAVDVFDVKSRNPAFHGTASRKLSSDGPLDQSEINEVAAAALAPFPVVGAVPSFTR